MTAKEFVKKYKLEQQTWNHKGFHSNLLFFFQCGEQAIKPLKEYYGDYCRFTVFAVHDRYCDWYWSDAEMERLRNSFIHRVNKNTKELDNLLDEWHKRLRTLDKIIGRVNKTDLTKLTDKELLNIYMEWYQAYLAEYGIAITIQDGFSMYADVFLEPYFRKIIADRGFADKFNEYFVLLTSPVDESFFTQEYRDRLKLLKNPSKENIAKHTKKYHWLHNNYAKVIRLNTTFFRNELKELKGKDPDKENKKLDKQLAKVKEDKAALMKKLNLDQEAKNLIRITEVFAYMQDERKKYVLIDNVYHQLFIEEFSRRLNIPLELLEYMTAYEAKDLLDKKMSIEELKRRKDFSLVFQDIDGYQIISGEEGRKLYEKLFVKKEKNVDEVKGLVAAKGVARGVAKIVMKIHDIINVNEGDILVSSMTRPEMVAAMKKASAIVTDEGGVTCHAAIVSREMGKPCIIGTKIATKVFKDGDRVEVDADKGIVKKLNKQNGTSI